jgi:serine protease Do
MQVHKLISVRRIRQGFAVILLAGTALGGYAAGHVSWADSAPSTTTSVQAPSGAIQPTGTQHLLPDFSDLVTQVRPAVVSITTKLRPTEVADDEMPLFPGMRRPGGQERGRAVEARGSGFIIDADGTVVTNNHVVKDAQSVSVTLDDGTQLPAKIIGHDAKTDIAVLRISAGHKLPFIQLGESDDIKPGQWVVAMGNPFGLGGSVTSGIVSARGRDIGSGPYDSFIQVDAPINQGNSGGPLFTQDGKVVGVNTAILSPSGGSVGIGFAIPSDTVRTVVAELEKSGHITRGYLGVQAQSVNGAMTAALRLPSGQGALVANIEPDSPAAKAGLQPGDVIQSVDGKKIGNPRDLAVDIAAVAPGSSTKLTVLRDGNSKDMSVTVASLPSDTSDSNSPGQHRGIGVALSQLSPDLRSQLGVPSRTHGAVVAQVEPGSPAEQAGLQPGDIVVGVGDKAVSSPEEAVSAIRAATSDGKAAALRIMRDGNTAFVAVAPAGAPDQG